MGLRLHDSKLRWSCCLLNFISVLFIYLARVKSTNVLKHQHITHTKHGSDKENNMYQETCSECFLQLQDFLISHWSPSTQPEHFFYCQKITKKNQTCGKAHTCTHIHAKTFAHCVSSCSLLFVDYVKKISPDSSHKLLFQVSGNVFLHYFTQYVCLALLEYVCVCLCMRACMYIIVNEIFSCSA